MKVTLPRVGLRYPNSTERRLIESFLVAKLQGVIELAGPVPSWLSGPKSVLEAGRE
jgi:hypothetical protein